MWSALWQEDAVLKVFLLASNAYKVLAVRKIF